MACVTVPNPWNASNGGGSTTGGITTYFNYWFIDQSGGTGDTFGVLSGTLDGVNTTFTVSQGKYLTGTLNVYLNGQLLTQGTSEDWTETSPATGVFDFIIAPEATDEVTVIYSTQDVLTNSPMFFRDLQSVSSDYTLTLNDRGVLVDASSGPITITLPAAATAENYEFFVKKIDISANNVIIDPDSSENIDGALVQTLSSQYEVSNFISDGTEWWLLNN